MVFFVQLLLVAASLSSVAFASKPTTLATAIAVQPTTALIKRCQNKSHEEVLAERRKIADAIAQTMNENGESVLLSPLIQIVASYCATPIKWQKMRELRLPDNKPSGEAIADSRVKSVAELVDNKIFVSYANGLGVTWDLSENNSMPTFLQPGVIEDVRFLSSTGQDNVLVGDINKHDETGRKIVLINALTGRRASVAIDGTNSIVSHIYYPGAYCAVSLRGGRAVYLLENSSEGKLISRSLGSFPIDKLADRNYEFDQGRLSLSPEIQAMCPLPNGRLAVGDGFGNLGIVRCADGIWEPLLRTCSNEPFDFDIEAIVGWPDEIIAVLSDSREVGKSGQSISWWDVKQNKELKFTSTPDALKSIYGIGALPNRQIAVEGNAGTCDIYTVIYDESSSSIRLERAQTLTNKAVRWSYAYDLPLYLRKFIRPTLAMATKEGTVEILEEDVCPDCEPASKVKTTKQDTSCS